MRQATTQEVNYTVNATAGQARAGRLTTPNATVQTPTLFPVLNFYAGGMERSVFGGGVHRTVKECLIGADRVGGEEYSEYFDGVMTSVASLTDYNISRERYEDYLSIPIKERDIFEPLSGMLFLDSGGFKFLNSDEIDGSDFEVEIDQRTIYEMQQKMGGDMIVNLDHPIAPDDDYDTRIEKARKTGANIAEFVEISSDFEGARYLTLHGYNYSMMDAFLDEITDAVPLEILQETFDGVALGSLVPKKDNRDALITAVTDCRQIMRDWGFENRPLHVLGISSRAIPLLAALGADSFDSMTYMYHAINGKYSRSLMEAEPVDEVDFTTCDCPVCNNDTLVGMMRKEGTEYRKDEIGPVAMHNLIIHMREVRDIRRRIQTGETGPLIEYIESNVARDKRIRQYAHQVVNDALGGYF